MSLKSSTYFGSTKEIFDFFVVVFVCDESGFGLKLQISVPL